ncbi:MAG: RNA methyltransferase [Ignavibacteriales bacterium]|nr:RNA methyltransferase [Ignavibacteriales bacterium]
MLTRNELKYYSSLLQKKHRAEEKKFLVEGDKLIQEAVGSGLKCESIISSHLFYEKSKHEVDQFEKRAERVEIVKQIDFEKLCDTKTPQGIVGVFAFPGQSKQINRNEKVITALENVSDPGNMGTILRNCDWFGIADVLISEDCAEIFNPKVIRSSAGSVFHLNIIEPENFYAALQNLKRDGYKILCADLNGEDIYELKKNSKTILVLANEANGPSPKILELSDKIVTIPRKGKAESLNVASASAVLFSELTRD